MIEYLKMDKYMKPKDKSVTDHQGRMEEIMWYSTKLEGAWNNLSNSEIKTILFTSFPVPWQINYKKNQPAIQGASVEAIVIFMSQEKEFADQSNRQANHYQEWGGGGGRGRGQGRSRSRPWSRE